MCVCCVAASASRSVGRLRHISATCQVMMNAKLLVQWKTSREISQVALFDRVSGSDFSLSVLHCVAVSVCVRDLFFRSERFGSPCGHVRIDMLISGNVGAFVKSMNATLSLVPINKTCPHIIDVVKPQEAS